MNLTELEKLHRAVESLRRRESFSSAVERLQTDLGRSSEPFVWSTVTLEDIDTDLPAQIKSCWIFLLRRDTASGCHYHPNSIQHMIALNGGGRSRVGGVERPIVAIRPSGSSQDPIAEQWHVIEKNVPHEFFPEGEDLTVVSFHTCEADELEEIDCESGSSRIYEPSDV